MSNDHGLLGDECAIVTATDGDSWRSGRPPCSPVGKAVPSGSTRTPPALGGGGAGRGMETETKEGVLRGALVIWWLGDAEAWLKDERLEPVLLIAGDSGGRGGSWESVEETWSQLLLQC